MKVKVYWNNRKRAYNIVDCETGWVIARARSVLISEAELKVHQTGRLMATRFGHKNIHHFLVGNLVKMNEHIDTKNFNKAEYNQNKNNCFVDVETSKPINKANLVYCVNNQVFYRGSVA